MRERLDLPVAQVSHPLSHSCDRPDNGPPNYKEGNQEDQQDLSNDVPERVAPNSCALRFDVRGVVKGSEDTRYFRFAVQRECVAVHGGLADCLKRTETMSLGYTLRKQIGGIRYDGGEFRAQRPEPFRDRHTQQYLIGVRGLQIALQRGEVEKQPHFVRQVRPFPANFRPRFPPAAPDPNGGRAPLQAHLVCVPRRRDQCDRSTPRIKMTRRLGFTCNPLCLVPHRCAKDNPPVKVIPINAAPTQIAIKTARNDSIH